MNKNQRFCLSCGCVYHYISTNPLGASSERCVSCQRKNVKHKAQFELLSLAGKGIIQCRCCSYQKRIHALSLYPVINFLVEPDVVIKAKKSIILCLNCHAALKGNDIQLKIIDSNTYPVKVEMYEQHVTIEEKEIAQAYVPSSDAEELEIVKVIEGYNITRGQVIRKLESSERYESI